MISRFTPIFVVAAVLLSACGPASGTDAGSGGGGGSIFVGGGGGSNTGGGSGGGDGGGGVTGGGGGSIGGGGGSTTGGGGGSIGGGGGTTGGGGGSIGGGGGTTGGGGGSIGGGGGTTCSDTCTSGVSICDGTDVRVCQADAVTGCRSFVVSQTCTGGQTCSGGVCRASCTNQCTLGATQCASSGAPVACQTLANSCTDWVLQPSCGANRVCSGGACVATASCTNQCTLGQTRCTAGSQQQTCVALPSGCTDWTLPVACSATQSCTAPATACGVAACTAGAKRCNSTTPAVETCDVSGNWYTSAQCPQACSNGACTATSSCNAGTVRCNGTNIEICNASGSAWLYNQTCPNACTAGVCSGGCTAGEKRCNGAVPETCNSGGTGWTAATSCMYECYQGACTQNDLIVDGTTVPLEGDLKFSNSVIIRNNGQLRVGPSGILKIRARTITIDANTTLNANDLGDETRGTNASRSSCYIANSTNCQLVYGSYPGSSYGTSGAGTASASQSAYCPYYGSTYSCTTPAVAAGSLYDRDDDLSISKGSVWQTTKGGGLVQLIADTVTVNGQITSNTTGTGASGGGVLIAANTISGNGVIQTAGAGTSPTGGNGRVKLLRGVTNNLFSGTIVGNQRISPMPPLDLVSGSHPDQSRWYNDGLGDWYLAWSKPYPTLVGYYYKLSTSPNTLPTNAAGNGTLISTESVVIPAPQLVPGINYVHLVSVDSAFNVGTVKATQTMQLNTTPPAITSPSNPTQRTWGGGNALYFNWANPQADSNYTGYYFVLDHFADTVPPPNANNFTSNKQVLLSNTPDGIWVFHVVNRDTRGAITKAASHFVVYVGTNPGAGNLSGSAFDGSASNAPLAGVTITVNRGLFSATTAPTTGTYTFSNTLPAGTWEITASKVGYQSVTRTVVITASGSVNENFTLVH